MKKKNKFLIIMSIFSVALLLVTCINNVKAQEIKIGMQTWAKTNLNVSTFRNGDTIPQAKTNEEWAAAGNAKKPAWCYYNNDTANGKKHGKMYNWYAVNDPRGLAPKGWHVPSDAEFTKLIDSFSDIAGIKMKSTTGWENDGNGTNASGFTALPVGSRDYNGVCINIGEHCYFWSSTESDTGSAWIQALDSNYSGVTHDYKYNGYGLSVRCIKD